MLVNLSLFIAGMKQPEKTQQKKTTEFVAPPVLNPTYTATNSATVTISGLGLDDQTISLYVNDELISKKKVEEDGSFVFEDVRLPADENKIKARAINKNGDESEYSDVLAIQYKKDAPKLSIDTPSDNQSFTKDEDIIRVSGKTDAASTVTVNDFRAIVDSDGTYNYSLRLNPGDNTIKVVAVDEAGNKTEAERKVTYAP